MKILITGATSGIGKSVALELAKKKHCVYLTCHTEKETQKIKKELSNFKNINVIKIDITNNYDRQKVLKLNLDVLYNHAGIGQGGSILEANIDDVRNNFEVNVFSSFQLLQDVLKQMIDKNHGRIVVMSSLTALMPIPFVGIYSATKASISTIVRMLQLELKLITNNVKVVLIEPGMYHTGFNQLFLANKYNNSKYFKNYRDIIYRYENIFFKLGEKKRLNTIASKIVTSITSKKPKRVYRAPLGQVICAKIINIFK